MSAIQEIGNWVNEKFALGRAYGGKLPLAMCEPRPYNAVWEAVIDDLLTPDQWDGEIVLNEDETGTIREQLEVEFFDLRGPSWREVWVFTEELLRCRNLRATPKEITNRIQAFAADMCVSIVGVHLAELAGKKTGAEPGIGLTPFWPIVFKRCIKNKIIPVLRNRFRDINHLPPEVGVWKEIEHRCLELILSPVATGFLHQSVVQTLRFLVMRCLPAINVQAAIAGGSLDSKVDQGDGSDWSQEETKLGEEAANATAGQNQRPGENLAWRRRSKEGPLEYFQCDQLNSGSLEWHYLLARIAQWGRYLGSLKDLDPAKRKEQYSILIRAWCLEVLRNPHGWPSRWLVDTHKAGHPGYDWGTIADWVNRGDASRKEGYLAPLKDALSEANLPPGVTTEEAWECFASWRLRQREQSLSEEALRKFLSKFRQGF